MLSLLAYNYLLTDLVLMNSILCAWDKPLLVAQFHYVLIAHRLASGKKSLHTVICTAHYRPEITGLSLSISSFSGESMGGCHISM